MMLGRFYLRPRSVFARTWLLVAALLLGPPPAAAGRALPIADLSEEQVVLVAPFDILEFGFGICDSPGVEGCTPEEVLARYSLARQAYRTQMRIMREAARYNKVAVVVSRQEQADLVVLECAYYRTCEAIQNGSVVFLSIPHDTIWVRDYAPFIYRDQGGSPVVRDPPYAMAERDRVEQLQLAILTRQYQGYNKGVEQLPVAVLQLATKEMDLFSNREQDDAITAPLIEELFDERPRHEEIDALVIDGGNLLRSEDRTCFTTEDIRTDNLAYTDGVIKKYLRRLFGCRRVVILEPIPGPVIKHVDMFLLPGRGKNLILAGYPSESYSAEQWGPLSAEVRALVEEADQVMDRNQRLLERAGYRVFRMRSPLPVEDVDMGLWFPTMLNGLPLPKGLGGTQVLLPRYRDVPPSYMDRSQAIFRQAFGADTELVPIESSGPGQWQGAVHCLTATVALDLTRFSELATETRFRERVADWFNAPISRDLEAFAGDWVATGDGKLNGYHVLSDMFGLSIVGNFVHMTMGDTPPVLAGVLEPCEGDTGWCFEPYFPGMTTTTLRVEVRGDGLRLEGTEGRPVDLRLRQGATEDPW